MQLLNPPPASDVVRLSRFRIEIPLIGEKNRVNLVFFTPDKFLPSTLALYFNGMRMRRGASEDYSITESGGLGSGYDTIELLDVVLAPGPNEQLFADYISAT